MREVKKLNLDASSMDPEDESYSAEERSPSKKRKKKKSKSSREVEEPEVVEVEESHVEVSSSSKKKKSKSSREVQEPEIFAEEELEIVSSPSKKKKKKKSKDHVDVEEEPSEPELPPPPPPVSVPMPSSSKSVPAKKPARAPRKAVVKLPVQKSQGKPLQKARAAKFENTWKTLTAIPSKSAGGANGDIEETDDRVAFNGMQILTTMSNDDIEELLHRIDLQCPVNDTKKERARELQINWGEVAFSSYGPVQCKSVWFYLRTQARTFRILHEIVDEVRVNFKTDYNKFMKKVIESSPEFPKQPYAAGGFQFYCKELWDSYKDLQHKMNAKVENFLSFQTKCYQDWQSLSDATREEYNKKAKSLKADHQKQIKEYYAKFPGFAPRAEKKLDKDGKPEKPMARTTKKIAVKISNELYKDAPRLPLTPLQLFVNSKLNHLDPPPTLDEIPDLKRHYVEKWTTLSESKKLKWIQNCIKKSERYLEEVKEYKRSHPLYLLPKDFKMSRIIGKEDCLLYFKAKGQPPKPKQISFDIFLEEFATSDEALGIEDEFELRRLAMTKWEALDWYQQGLYKMKHQMHLMTFKKDFEEYYNKLPHLLRASAIDVLPKKFKKPFQDEIDKIPLVLADEEPEALTAKHEVEDEEANVGKRKRTASATEASSQESQEEEHETDGITPKKKKKKKRKKHEEEELDTVTNSSFLQPSNNKPLYLMELTEDHKKLIEEKITKETIKAGRRKNKADETEEVDVDTTDNKRKNKVQPPHRPGNIITQHMLGETIRGIFDGRQFYRHFSPYYYYAKYVIGETCWAEMIRKCGLVQTAAKIIETFNRLSPRQQKNFIDEAMQFHSAHRKYASDISTVEDIFAPKVKYFKEEPKIPPRNAESLYLADIRIKRRSDGNSGDANYTPWSDLDEKTQMAYLKKLYRINREYVTEYEKFIKNMTPNDMVEYLISRCHEWEVRRKKKPYGSYRGKLIDGICPMFASETYRAELSDDGQESEAEVYELNQSLVKATSFRYKKNPFKEKASQVNKHVEKQDKELRRRYLYAKSRKNKRLQTEGVDSDLPSSSDEDDCDPDEFIFNKLKYKKEKEFRAKLREQQRYYYPLEDFYEFSAKSDLCLPKFWWERASKKKDKYEVLQKNIRRKEDACKPKPQSQASKKPPPSKPAPVPRIVRKKIAVPNLQAKPAAAVAKKLPRKKLRKTPITPKFITKQKRAKVILPKLLPREHDTAENNDFTQGGNTEECSLTEVTRDSISKKDVEEEEERELQQRPTPTLMLVTSTPQKQPTQQTFSSSEKTAQDHSKKESRLIKPPISKDSTPDYSCVDLVHDAQPAVDSELPHEFSLDHPSPELFPEEAFGEEEVDPYAPVYWEDRFSAE